MGLVDTELAHAMAVQFWLIPVLAKVFGNVLPIDRVSQYDQPFAEGLKKQQWHQYRNYNPFHLGHEYLLLLFKKDKACSWCFMI